MGKLLEAVERFGKDYVYPPELETREQVEKNYVYNSLRDKRYIHLKKYMEKVHTNLKDMLLKYQGLC